METFELTKTYFDKYVSVAGRGNILVEYARHINRLQLVCKKCNVTLTTSMPKGTEVDYSIQAFIEIHGHNGGHNLRSGVCNTCGGYATTGHATDCPRVKKVTLDFKPLGPSPLPPFQGPMNYKDYVNCTDYTFTSNNTNATVQIPTRAELEAMLVLFNEDLQNAEKREAKPNKHRLKTLKTATGRRFR